MEHLERKMIFLNAQLLLQTYLGVSTTINNALRLGKKSTKPRLLKLSLNSIQDKAIILKNKTKLRPSNNPSDVHKIFIMPDFTPLKQRQNKALRQQLAAMNKDKKLYVIKKWEDSAEDTSSAFCTISDLPPKKDSPNPADHSLIALSLNCQSLPAKKESFVNLINTHSPDIIFGSESWLKDTIFSSDVFPTGYAVYRRDRPDGYGGVFVACHDSHVSYSLDLTDCSCEIVACEIKLANNTSLIVCSIYRPPSTGEHYLQKLCTELDSIINGHPSSTVWIAGDVNLPDINWSSHCVTGHGYSLNLNNIFLNFLDSNGLTQTVESPKHP